ncbi:capsid protein gpB [Natrialba phage PhiCh1]|uniref:Capsid protein gpB n=1 Tax=Natrialba phage PhiCh1 TaxID=114777 RepID=Q8JL46_9CAUD|nr:capsid protein gpB [Natrialba phage PhiCh1]AAM88684.1 capsid protein gpB [Natrialba phage PhiCh1]
MAIPRRKQRRSAARSTTIQKWNTATHPTKSPTTPRSWQMFKSWLAGTGGPFDAAESDDGVSPAEGQSEVSAGTFSKAIDVARDVTKEGRTLNATNREALMAGHDAIEMALESDVDFETNRFTDDDSTEFDIVQYGSSGESDDETEKSRPVEKLTEEQGELVLAAIQRFVDNQGEAAFSEFRSWVWSTDILDDDTAFAADEAAYQYREWDREQREQTSVTEDFLDWVQDESDTDTEITMSKDDNTDSETDKAMEDAPEWGQAIYEEQQKNSDRIDELSKAIDDEGDADGGETSESDGDSSGDGEGETSKSADGETAPEWVQPIQDGIEKNAENIQAVAQASGHSQQLDYDGEAGTEKNADEEPDDGEVKKAFLGL